VRTTTRSSGGPCPDRAFLDQASWESELGKDLRLCAWIEEILKSSSILWTAAMSGLLSADLLQKMQACTPPFNLQSANFISIGLRSIPVTDW